MSSNIEGDESISVGYQISLGRQPARLLQIDIILEEVVKVCAYHHHEELNEDAPDEEIRALFLYAAEESVDHRERLEAVIDRLAVDSVSPEEIEVLVEAQYGQTRPEDFDGVLYDQLCNEETTYEFYNDVIEATEVGEAQFSVDHEEFAAILSVIRDEEAEGVEEVTRIMEDRE